MRTGVVTVRDLTKIDSDTLFSEYSQTRDVEVRNELITRYLYIAEIAAKKFAGRGVDYEDLYQVASLALVKAIERFEPERGIKFSSYATPSLIGEIKNYFRDSSRVMRLPRRDTEQLKRMNLYIQEYLASHGSLLLQHKSRSIWRFRRNVFWKFSK